MIKVLEKNIADKISAGEVVERPLSVVKELVENSIDASATSITVEIKNGGKSFIRVTDNGCGILGEEVEIAFLRHATSKIREISDLSAIDSLGFRGEALASISAVTRTTLITKTEKEKTGKKIVINGGEIIENSVTGCPDGTTIIVTDLFYNTPARRKFLKNDGAESGLIIDFLSEIALAYSKLKIQLINNGKIIFSTRGDGNQKNTLTSVYNRKEYRDLIEVNYNTDEYKITGCISKPSLSRTSRREQVFFVNGRVIKSKILDKGVNEGYKERLFEGRYPIVFLFIKVDPAEVDVNIHPNKREIRFNNEKSIIENVRNAIVETLSSKKSLVEFSDYYNPKTIYEKETPLFLHEEKSTDNIEQVDIKNILKSKRCESESKISINEEEKKTDNNIEEECKPELKLERPNHIPFNFEELQILGSIFDTYITCVDSNSFYLIDQHAAQERIFYEKLVSEYLSDTKPGQVILTPITVDVPISLGENSYNWLDSLRDMGYVIDNFGPDNSYIIREIPFFMEISEAENFVKYYIEQLDENINLRNSVVIDKLIMRSCKSAIKAHDKLSHQEKVALLNELSHCKNPFSCPHGRPTFLRFSIYDIEKMFKRV